MVPSLRNSFVPVRNLHRLFPVHSCHCDFRLSVTCQLNSSHALSHDVASVFRDRMLASASGSLTWRYGDRDRERYTYYLLIIISWLQFPLQNRGCWHPQKLRFWRASLNPYRATKSRTMGWQPPRNHQFWKLLDCILVGPWFCRQGPQHSAGSAQNLTFWVRNWFWRNKAGDVLRSLIL